MERDDERRAFFDARAHGWEERNYPKETRKRVEDLVASLDLEPGSRVLDVGCGEGILIPFLRDRIGETGRIVALDPSGPMLEGAAKKDGGRAFLLLARAESIPLPSSSIDAVVCFAAFPHFSDKQAAASEFFRVLAPGGRAVVAHLKNRDELNAHHGEHPAVAHDLLPGAQAMNRIFAGAGFARTSLDERSGWYFYDARKD